MKKKTPVLIWILIISTVLVAAVGGYLKYAVLKPLDLYQDESIIAVPFLLIADEEAKYTLRIAQEETVPAPSTEPAVTQTEAPIPESEPETVPVTEAVPETEPPTEPVVIDESWFDDALFIGDSRTESFSVYSPLGQAHYFCNEGMSLFDVQSVLCDVSDFPSLNLKQLLTRQPYGKIYIGLGLNGIMSTHENILANYQSLIDTIKEVQPDAVIVLQAIMTVSRDKAASKRYYSLENIYSLNDGIAALAEENGIYYIDVNEWIADEEGYLPDDLTKDGCHLYAPVYEEWAQWFIDTAATLGVE